MKSRLTWIALVVVVAVSWCCALGACAETWSKDNPLKVEARDVKGGKLALPNRLKPGESFWIVVKNASPIFYKVTVSGKAVQPSASGPNSWLANVAGTGTPRPTPGKPAPTIDQQLSSMLDSTWAGEDSPSWQMADLMLEAETAYIAGSAPSAQVELAKVNKLVGEIANQAGYSPGVYQVDATFFKNFRAFLAGRFAGVSAASKPKLELLLKEADLFGALVVASATVDTVCELRMPGGGDDFQVSVTIALNEKLKVGDTPLTFTLTDEDKAALKSLEGSASGEIRSDVMHPWAPAVFFGTRHDKSFGLDTSDQIVEKGDTDDWGTYIGTVYQFGLPGLSERQSRSWCGSIGAGTNLSRMCFFAGLGLRLPGLGFNAASGNVSAGWLWSQVKGLDGVSLNQPWTKGDPIPTHDVWRGGLGFALAVGF